MIDSTKKLKKSIFCCECGKFVGEVDDMEEAIGYGQARNTFCDDCFDREFYIMEQSRS